MTHEAGKGDTMRPTNHEAFSQSFDRIFGKPKLPQNCGTGYCSCLECLKDDLEDDELTCPSCGGPMYTQAHWRYSQCDDCGRREDKEIEL